MLSFSIYFISIGYPLFVASLNPTKVPARITHIYHRRGGAKSIGRRVYNYEYKYEGKIYHGQAESPLNEVIGSIGDTIIIRCNKVLPKYSAFWRPDDPNLEIRVLSPKERQKLYEKEPDQYKERE